MVSLRNANLRRRHRNAATLREQRGGAFVNPAHDLLRLQLLNVR